MLSLGAMSKVQMVLLPFKCTYMPILLQVFLSHCQILLCKVLQWEYFVVSSVVDATVLVTVD